MAWNWKSRSRRRPPTKGGGIFMMVLAVAILIGGLVMSVVQVNKQHDLEKLRDGGQRIAGEVINCRHEEKRSKRSTTHHYYVTVSYQHNTGAGVTKEIEVEEGAYGRFAHANPAVPAPCQVLADPGAPEHFTIQEAVEGQIEEKNTSAWLAAILGAIVAFILAGVGFYNYKAASSAPLTTYPAYPPQGPAPGNNPGVPYAPGRPPLGQSRNPYGPPPRNL